MAACSSVARSSFATCTAPSSACSAAARARLEGSGALVLLEVLRQLQALRLVVRADALAVDLVGDLGEFVVDQSANDLPILQNERDVEAAHFEHGLGPRRLSRRVAEAGIEEAGIMHA